LRALARTQGKCLQASRRSESRPGQFSYQDSSSGQKYQTKELAWQNYCASILQSEQAQALLAQGLPQPSQQAPPQQAAAAQLAADILKPSPLQPTPTMNLAAYAAMPAAKMDSPYVYAARSGVDVGAVSTDGGYVASRPSTQNLQSAGAAVSVVQRAASTAASRPQTVTDLPSFPQNFQTANGAAASTVQWSAPTAAPQPQTVRDVIAAPQPQTVSDLSSLPQPQGGSKLSKPFPGYGQSFAVGTNAGYEAYLASQGLN